MNADLKWRKSLKRDQEQWQMNQEKRKKKHEKQEREWRITEIISWIILTILLAFLVFSVFLAENDDVTKKILLGMGPGIMIVGLIYLATAFFSENN